MKATELIQNLSVDIDNIVRIIETDFLPLSTSQLNWKESAASWSVLECLEHLNRYCRYYNTAIEIALQAAGPSKGTEEAKSTWMGKKFIEMMSPKNVKKQKTMKHLNPLNSSLDETVITEFLNHQQQLKKLLFDAKRANVNRTKVPVEFFKLLKMNLGDAFQFLVVHEQRHMIQLQNILLKINQGKEPALKI